MDMLVLLLFVGAVLAGAELSRRAAVGRRLERALDSMGSGPSFPVVADGGAAPPSNATRSTRARGRAGRERLMRPPVRRLSAQFALVGALATVWGVGGPALEPAGAASQTGSPSCSTAGMVVWLNTQGNGTAGSIYYDLEFTNLSGRTCTLYGYPGVSGVTLSGRQLGSAASRNPAQPRSTVSIADGASALTPLQIVNVGNFSQSVCGPTTAAGLRVYPPNQRASKIVPFPFGACARSGPIYLSVQVVRPA